jgi:outer membrane protein TolC
MLGAGGCAVAPDIHRRVADEVHGLVSREAALPERGGQTGPAGRSQRIEDVLADVVRHDHHYRLALADVALSDEQIVEARRLPLPRLFADGLIEMPVNDGRVRSYLSGGLFLRLDLVQACFYRNAVTVAEVSRTARREACRVAAARAVCGVLSSLVRLKSAMLADQQNDADGILAAEAGVEAEALFKSGQAASDRWFLWQRRCEQTVMEKQRSAARVQKARSEVRRAYPGGATEAELLRMADGFMGRLAAAPDSAASSADILERSPTVSEAKLNWFFAEMAVLDARLKRLPSVSFSLGGGDIPLRGNEGREDGHIVPMLGVSVPLIDFGDVTRGVTRARIHAAQSRERMIEAVETAQLDIESATRNREQAGQALEVARKRVDALRKRRGETRALAGTGSVPVLDLREVAWMQAEAEGALIQADEECALAVLAERAARSELLDAGMETAVTCGPGWDPEATRP